MKSIADAYQQTCFSLEVLSCKLAMRPTIKGVPPCVTVVVFDLHKQLASINRTATCITHGMKYARLEVSSGKDQ